METFTPREPFAQVPLALLIDRSIPAEARCAYGVICACKPAPDGWRYLHAKKLAAQLGINERNAKRYTAQLCKAGWLHKEGDGGCNRPARYRPLTVKTMSSGDMVFDQNHVIRRHGQEVDTADTLTTGEVRGNAPRARKTAPLTAGTAPGKKEFLKLHVGFVPPGSWEPILVKARQARLDAGKGLLPISETFLIEKFLQRKAGKELTLDVIESDFMEWYLREKPPRKTGGTQRPATPAAPLVMTQVSPPTAAPPPEGSIKTIMAQLAGDKSLKNPGNARPNPQASPLPSTHNPERRARLAAEFQATHGYPLPENCRV